MKNDQSTEAVPDDGTIEDPNSVLKERLDRLEHESREGLRLAEQRFILAELKVEAMQAGILDLDGLKFLDIAQIHIADDGGIAGGAEAIGRLKRTKPWLFSVPLSSSIAKVPPSGTIRQKLATDMTDEEYRIARANIIKRSRL
jgi:hypothetical protein